RRHTDGRAGPCSPPRMEAAHGLKAQSGLLSKEARSKRCDVSDEQHPQRDLHSQVPLKMKPIPKVRFLGAALAFLNSSAYAEQANTMKAKVSVGGSDLTATLNDSETARDFVSLLPLTLTMRDLLRREKFAH